MSSTPPTLRETGRDADHPLARAFASFTEAAGSLERTYGQLQGHVAQLCQELEVTNRELATSLEDNHRIRERLRCILEGLPCGVMVVEAQGRISTLNPEAERLVGGRFESEEALPPELCAALHQARKTGVEGELAISSFGSGEGASGIDQGSNSEAVWVAIRHAWLEQSQSRASSVYILRDVSQAKKLEQEREKLRRQQALVEVSALLAHEIRNPLGSLELFAGLLAESDLGGESRGWIEHVQAGLRMLSATVNNVLHLHSAPALELDAVDAGQILEWAHSFLLPLAKQARVELELVNGLKGVVVYADRHRLEQVLLNLALNAFRSMPGGGWLGIHGNDCSAESVEVWVRDSGTGIAPDDLPRIFQPGFSTRAGSSGLGLVVCQRILEQHRGSITVESKFGHGAAFRIRLPRCVSTRPAHMSSAAGVQI
jgi:two-component system sensor histidine kinase FlrB